MSANVTQYRDKPAIKPCTKSFRIYEGVFILVTMATEVKYAIASTLHVYIIVYIVMVTMV